MKTIIFAIASTLFNAQAALADCPSLEGLYLCSASSAKGVVEIEQTLADGVTTYQINKTDYRADEQIYEMPKIENSKMGLTLLESKSAKCLANRLEMTVIKHFLNERLNADIWATTRTTWRLTTEGELLITSHITIQDPRLAEPEEGKAELICARQPAK